MVPGRQHNLFLIIMILNTLYLMEIMLIEDKTQLKI